MKRVLIVIFILCGVGCSWADDTISLGELYDELSDNDLSLEYGSADTFSVDYFVVEPSKWDVAERVESSVTNLLEHLGCEVISAPGTEHVFAIPVRMADSVDRCLEKLKASE